jgi:hypothetical protein
MLNYNTIDNSMCNILLLFFLFLSRPTSTWAVMAQVGSQVTGVVQTTAVDSVNLTLNGVTSGNLLVVSGIADGTPTSIGVTDNRSTSYTVSTFAVGSTERMFIAWGVAGTSNSFLVNVNPAGGGNSKMRLALQEFSGAHATPTEIFTATGSGTDAVPSISVTPTYTNAYIYGVLTHTDNGNIAMTPGSGYTQLAETENTTGITANFEWMLLSSPAAQAVNWTLGSSQPWGIIAAVFRSADGSLVTSGGAQRKRIFTSE